MSSSAFSDSASASAAATYGACTHVDPAPMTIDVLDAMEAGVTPFGAIGAGQVRIVPAAVRAGNLYSSSEQECSKYYTRAFALDDDDAAKEFQKNAAEDDARTRTGPLGKRPKGTVGGLKGGNDQVHDPFGTGRFLAFFTFACVGGLAAYAIWKGKRTQY